MSFYTHHKSSIEVPIGYLFRLQRWLDIEVLDGRFESDKPLNIKFKGKLRPYQKATVNSVKTKTCGVIQSPTGSGKTVSAIKIICDKKQPTLIFVDRIELANQFKERLLQFTTLTEDDIGLLGAGIKNIKPVTIALLQTASKLPEIVIAELNNIFGMIICDEVHVVPANTFYHTITQFKAKYRYGFSATPERTDGLTDIIFLALGKIIHVTELTELKNTLSIPTVREIETDYYFPIFDSSEFDLLINDLTSDPTRNKLILDTCQEYKGRQMVLLCGRVSQALHLSKELNLMGFNSSYLVSSFLDEKSGKSKVMTKKSRQKVIDGLESETIDIVTSTYGLFHKGIDISTLDVLFFCSPIRSKIWVKQSIGRIMRKNPNATETPVVVDFVDKKVGLLKYQWYSRRAVYKELLT